MYTTWQKQLPFSQGIMGFFSDSSFSSVFLANEQKDIYHERENKEFWGGNHNHTIKDVPEEDIFLSWGMSYHHSENSL